MNYELNQISVDNIIRGVAEVYSVLPSDIKGRCREERIAEARQVAMVLTWKALGGKTGCVSETGRLFERDHGTVLHAKRAVAAKMVGVRGMRERWKRLRHFAIPVAPAEHVLDYQI